MTAIFSFLGSAIFRWALEKIFGLWERKQDHAQELELMRTQAELAQAAHQRQLELLGKQAELQLASAELEHRGAMEQGDLAALRESIASAKPTGVRWVDAWSGSIRPAVSTVCLVLWMATLAWALATPAATPELVALRLALVEFTMATVGVVLGWHFGTRSLMPGKK